MKDCIFCKIVEGTIPCSKVYENENVLAFDDIHPMAPVHVVVIPKTHIPTLLELETESGNVRGDLVRAIHEVVMVKGIAQNGFRVVINCNEEGGQVIFHLHAHVLGGKRLKDELA